MPVARRIGLKIDVRRASREDAIFTRHWPPFLVFCRSVRLSVFRLIVLRTYAQ
jgi:hypothetical protein